MNHNITLKTNDITLRPVVSNDLEKMRRWRNSDWARSFFLTNEIISEEQQKKWYESYINKPDDYMFIIQLGDIDVGTAALYHVDSTNRSSEFGRLLVAEEIARGKGVGEKVVASICNFALGKLKLKEVTLEVFSDNTKAIHIYTKAGFRLIEKYPVGGKEVYKMVFSGETNV